MLFLTEYLNQLYKIFLLMKPIKRLREQYKRINSEFIPELAEAEYNSVRAFCLDCNILSFNEINRMEYDVRIELETAIEP